MLIGCASTNLSKSSEDKIRADMAYFNQRTRAYLYNKVLAKDLSSLDTRLYNEILESTSLPSEIDYLNFWKRNKSNTLILSSKKDFLLCIKSIQAKIIFCDIAGKSFVEYVSRNSKDMDKDLSEIAKKLEFKID